MSEISMGGLDLPRQVFHGVCCDARGKVVGKHMLRRAQVPGNFAKLTRCGPPGKIAAIDEARQMSIRVSPRDGVPRS